VGPRHAGQRADASVSVSDHGSGSNGDERTDVDSDHGSGSDGDKRSDVDSEPSDPEDSEDHDDYRI
jgi:hypothetical protein